MSILSKRKKQSNEKYDVKAILKKMSIYTKNIDTFKHAIKIDKRRVKWLKLLLEDYFRDIKQLNKTYRTY